MAELDLQVAARALLFKIHVVTGWVISEEKEYRNVLVDQFSKKLVEAYQEVNADEFEYAIRTYGTQVKDWGKQMNLSLIDEVMIPYLSKRIELSQIEESKSKPTMIENKENLSDQAMEEWIEELKKEKRVDFMPILVYEWLDKKGRPSYTKMQKFQALQVAAAHRRQQLIDQDSKELPEFMAMWTTGQFEGKILEHLKNLAKKFLLLDYLTQLK